MLTLGVHGQRRLNIERLMQTLAGILLRRRKTELSSSVPAMEQNIAGLL
jgi:hypothetical protein